MDTRPPDEEEKERKNEETETQKVKDAEPQTKANAKKKIAKDKGKSNLSEAPKHKVYVLMLGEDSRRLSEYVKKMMAAKSHLINMGWNVVGAFISAKATKPPITGKCTTPNTEHTKFEDELRKQDPEAKGWIQMAEADVIVRNSNELLRVMEAKAEKMPGSLEKYFRVSEFKANMSKEDFKGNTIVITNSDLEFLFARSKLENEMKARPETLTILRIDKEDESQTSDNETQPRTKAEFRPELTAEIINRPPTELEKKIADRAKEKADDNRYEKRPTRKPKRQRTRSPCQQRTKPKPEHAKVTKAGEQVEPPGTPSQETHVALSTKSEKQRKKQAPRSSKYQKLKKDQLSRTLCKILRHDADKYGLKMNKEGFVLLSELLEIKNVKKIYQDEEIKLETIQDIVEESDKKRFTMTENNDGKKIIRANQGHSVQAVDIQELATKELKPEDHDDMVCIHGTFWECESNFLYSWEDHGPNPCVFLGSGCGDEQQTNLGFRLHSVAVQSPTPPFSGKTEVNFHSII